MLMSDVKQVYQRKAYTLLTLLGDYGGFNGAVVFLLSFLMTTYSANMYEAAVASGLKYQTKIKRDNAYSNHSLRAKLDRQSSFALDKDDLCQVDKALRSVKRLKASFWKALCNIKLFCGKDKDVQAMHSGFDTFDGCLDIRSLVDVHANLNILLHLSLTA